MKKVICECGSSKWILKECISYNCFPPIHASIYECARCGKTYEKTTQQTMEEYYPEVEIFDNEPMDFTNIIVEDDNKCYTYVGTATTIDDITTIAEPSKVRYE